MQVNLLNQPAYLYGITNQMKPLSLGAADLVRSCYFQVCGCNLTVWPSLAVLLHCTICHSMLGSF